MEFRERLKLLRKERKLTQSGLAEVLNYGYTAISNYESGRNEPSISDLKKIAAYFEVSMDYLLCMSDIRNPYVETEESEIINDLKGSFFLLSENYRKELLHYVAFLVQMEASSGDVSEAYGLRVAEPRGAYGVKNIKESQDESGIY